MGYSQHGTSNKRVLHWIVDGANGKGGAPSLSTSDETLTIEESMTLRARTENAGHGNEYEWSWSSG
jgi:hypothetical protein